MIVREWVNFWGFCPVPLIYMPVFVPVSVYFDYKGFVVEFDIQYCDPSNLVLSQDRCGYLGLFWLHIDLWNICTRFVKWSDRELGRLNDYFQVTWLLSGQAGTWPLACVTLWLQILSCDVFLSMEILEQTSEGFNRESCHQLSHWKDGEIVAEQSSMTNLNYRLEGSGAVTWSLHSVYLVIRYCEVFESKAGSDPMISPLSNT